LKRYQKILRPGGKIHLKTDDVTLYDYSCNVVQESGLPLIANTHDLYSSQLLENIPNFTTYYEESHLKNQKTIKYLCFELTRID